MKPAPFEYVRPHTLDEALRLLAEHGDAAKLIAGGSELANFVTERMEIPLTPNQIRQIIRQDQEPG